MSQELIVIVNHKTKTATLNMVDDKNNLIAVDTEGIPLIGIPYPYSNIHEYKEHHESSGYLDKNNEKEMFVLKNPIR
ncbi:hypothetical protein [Chryseobacterium sp.]|uniref:hypothetical protein n=1 Tax=Chryseobacterium sp. TaxID=1871047 RepID=UPI002FCA7191